MTRTEFIIGLKNRLNLLSESECVDIIEEYTNHIDMKMQEGKSEADAINDFGNLDDLADEILAGDERIKLIEPLEVIDFHNFIAKSHIILTDSGGIQEEAPSLGKPVLVLRDTTERPEGIDAGTLKLVGTNEDTYQKEMLVSNLNWLLTDKIDETIT